MWTKITWDVNSHAQLARGLQRAPRIIPSLPTRARASQDMLRGSSSSAGASSSSRPQLSRPNLKLNRRIGAHNGFFVPQMNQPILSPRTEQMGGDPFGLLLRNRTIFMGGEVEDFGADALVSQLLLLDSQDQGKDIKLFINSPGESDGAANTRARSDDWVFLSCRRRLRDSRDGDLRCDASVQI